MSMQSTFIFGRTNPKSGNANWRMYLLLDTTCIAILAERQNEPNHPLLGGSYRSTQPFREIPRVRSRSFENASLESCRLNQPVRSPPAHVRRRLETEFALPSVRREDKMLPILPESRPKLINCKLSWAMAGSPSPLLGKCKRGLIVENGSVSSDQRNERHGAH